MSVIGAATKAKSALTKLGLTSLPVADKRVLIRVDFNVPFKKVRVLACGTRGGR